VLFRSDQSKTSLLFFHQPNYDAVVEGIPTCVDAEHPAKYGKTTSGEHVTMKITKHRAPALDDDTSAAAE